MAAPDNGSRLPNRMGRMMGQARPGGLILPNAEMAREAKEEATRWATRHICWCPTAGAMELLDGLQAEVRPLPVAVPVGQGPGGVVMGRPPSMWVVCPVCGEEHQAVVVFVPAEVADEDSEPDDSGEE